MPIGTCDACQREKVPVSHFNISYCGDTTACFLCQGDDNPDPYGELEIMTNKIPNPFETLGCPNPFKPAATLPNPFETVLADIAEIMEAKPVEVIEMRRPRLRDILTQFDERGRRIA